MAVKEELHGCLRIKPGIKVSGVRKDKCKTVNNSERETPLHPVHLGLFPRKEGKLMECLFLLFLPVSGGIFLYCIIAASISIRLEPFKSLCCPEKRVFTVPLPDKPLVRSYDAVPDTSF